MKSVKKKNKIEKSYDNFNDLVYLKFNFSFITYDKDFNDIHKAKLINRIMELSSEPYLVIANRNKNVGFEHVYVDIKKKIDSRFFEYNIRKFDGKYTIIRLYPNNNPKPSRIIGVLNNKIFYIFFIDINGELYQH